MVRYSTFSRVLSTGAPAPLAVITVYDVGTLDLSTIYDDDLTPPTAKANPFPADSNGFFYFYAVDGRYDVRVAPAGSTAYTLGDQWLGDTTPAIISTRAALPVASPSTAGRLAIVTDDIQGLFEDHGSAWNPVLGYAFPSYAFAGLPAAALAGRLARVTNLSRGFWMDTAAQWIALHGEVYDVRAFGAKGDGTTDDRTAIQAAITEADGNGGGVVLLPGVRTYRCDSPLSFDDVARVILRGPATILYKGSTAPAISLKSSKWLTFDHVHVGYDHAGFVGNLFETGHSGAATDALYLTWKNCRLYGSGVSGAAALIDFRKGIISDVIGCELMQAQRGIVGGVGAGNYTNVLDIRRNNFAQIVLDAIYCGLDAASEDWLIAANAFHQTPTGTSCGIAMPNAGSSWLFGLTILGNWFGDVSVNGGGPWVSVKALGALIAGNRMSTPGSGASDFCIEVATSEAVAIIANRLEAALIFNYVGAALANKGNSWLSNDLIGAGTVLTGSASLNDLVALGNVGYANKIYPDHSTTAP